MSPAEDIDDGSETYEALLAGRDYLRERNRYTFTGFDEAMAIIQNLSHECDKQIPMERTIGRIVEIFDEYQEQPHLLDPHLDALLTSLLGIVRRPGCPGPLLHAAFRCLYIITKVRGYKVIVRLLPHEVGDLEPVLQLLAENTVEFYELEMVGVRNETWATRYMLLLWLSIIAIIPFEISRFDSGEGRKPMMERILNAGKAHLMVTAKARDAAAYLLSKFITRPDVIKVKLAGFIEWSLESIAAADSSMAGLNVLSGNLSALSLIFKHGKREDLIPYAVKILCRLSDIDLISHKNSILRKLNIKVTQRLGLTFLKPKQAAWRYKRGNRTLVQNLQKQQVESDLTLHIENPEEEDYDIPDEIETVIELLLTGLRDKDTIVRWSAAKGVGRVTGRLPRELADDVLGCVLELFSIVETDSAWHGGCLALAELGRRGLLLPTRLAEVVPVVIKALMYDERRGNFSVGAHVRDAACYVCWAFARAYDPAEIQLFIDDIARALMIVTVFDREVTCRRAAAAAFQENVGRQGQIPHGIDILTTADYFAVGNKVNTFLNISVYIAQFDEYTRALIDHLIAVTIRHWDKPVRVLAAQSLHRLTPRAPAYMSETVLPSLVPLAMDMDLSTRHGALLSIAELTHALSQEAQRQHRALEHYVSPEVQLQMMGITEALDKAKLFRGLGGELMSQAVAVLLEKLALSQVPATDGSTVAAWLRFLSACFHHVEESVREGAVAALPAFCRQYCCPGDGNTTPDHRDEVIESYVKEMQSSAENVRMGHALALGALPRCMLNGRLKLVLSTLIRATWIKETETTWAMSRRDAVKAIANVCVTLGVDAGGSPDSAICSENIPDVMDCFLRAMTDYTHDSRGDVGAWVREAAMLGLKELMLLIAAAEPSLISPQMCESVMTGVAQQAAEKIDRTRAVAGATFLSLLLSESPSIPHIPHKEELLEIFPRSSSQELNWSAPSEIFPSIVRMLGLRTYLYPVLLGLCVSVGGLTESVVKHSSAAFFAFVNDLAAADDSAFCELCATLLAIFGNHQRKSRVTLPMLKMLDQMLINGCLSTLAGHDDASFLLPLSALCTREINKCGDPQKLMSCADVFCGLLQFAGKVRRGALFQLIIFLCHKYPRVRKTTAGKFYEALVTFDDVVAEDRLDDVLTILSETKWDDPINIVRNTRNELCEMLGVPTPKPIARPV